MENGLKAKDKASRIGNYALHCLIIREQVYSILLNLKYGIKAYLASAKDHKLYLRCYASFSNFLHLGPSDEQSLNSTFSYLDDFM